MKNFFKRTDNLTKALLQPINPAVVIFLGVATIAWGLWLLPPFWDVFAQAPIYSAIDFAPEWLWGTIAIVVGIATSYGAKKRSYKTLTRGATFASYHWLIVSAFLAAGNIGDPTCVLTLVMALYAAYVYLNIKVNHRYDHTQHRIVDIFHEVSHHCPECDFSVQIIHKEHTI